VRTARRGSAAPWNAAAALAMLNTTCDPQDDTGRQGETWKRCVRDRRMLPKCAHTANEPEEMRETARASADFKHFPLSQQKYSQAPSSLASLPYAEFRSQIL